MSERKITVRVSCVEGWGFPSFQNPSELELDNYCTILKERLEELFPETEIKVIVAVRGEVSIEGDFEDSEAEIGDIIQREQERTVEGQYGEWQ